MTSLTTASRPTKKSASPGSYVDSPFHGQVGILVGAGAMSDGSWASTLASTARNSGPGSTPSSSPSSDRAR